jgi:hypothetical protein
MKLSVNDWQDFSLKKDIEKLNKNIQRSSEVGATVFFDFIIAVTAVIFGNFFDEICVELKIAVYIISGILILLSILRLFLKRIKIIKDNCTLTVITYSIKEYIDSFDNEIWCCVMMSDSFLELLLKDVMTDNHRKMFYYSQTCFWLNKAIKKLSEMEFRLKKIFDDNNKNVISHKKVSTTRLLNLLDIMLNIKKVVNEKREELSRISGDENFNDICEKLTANKEYYETLKHFLSQVNIELGVDISRFQ